MDAVVDLLCVSPNEAARVLRFYKWDAGRLQDEWFSDPDAVKARVGLMDEQQVTRRKNEICKVCFDSFPVPDMCAARCGHYYCKNCWQGYIHASIDSGPASLDLRCIDPGCKAAVPRSIIDEVADTVHIEKFNKYGLLSFVEDSRKLTWCPAPDCKYATEALVDSPGEALDVFCNCGNAFCFNCKEEAHRPVDCNTVRKWLLKNSAESENFTWILANTKPCPKCQRPIEKNQGCMHMTCSQCRHEFCWLCQGPWSEHGERTGGFYNCNSYRKAKEEGQIDEDEQQRQHARQSLERYMHYWHRWYENDKSKKTALKQIQRFNSEKMEVLSERTATPSSQLRFVIDAWQEVVNCRRILKWTYAAGYYSFGENEGIESDKSPSALARKQQQQFFEFNQRDAEIQLEKLNQKIERDLHLYCTMPLPGGADSQDTPPPSIPWETFREQLIGLTDVTKFYFKKLVDEFEKGMEAVLSEYAAKGGGGNSWDVEMAEESGDGAGPSSSKAAGVSTANRRVTRAAAKRTRGGGGASASGAGADAEMLELERAAGHWYCASCTFANQLSNTRCEACERPKSTRTSLSARR